MTKPFSLTLFGSHPDRNNDDAWTGSDYATLAEARADLETMLAGKRPAGWYEGREVRFFAGLRSTEYFVIAGPGLVTEVVRNPGFKPSRDDFSAERSEAQMQAAMAYGVQGWNDFEGM